jgi:hypothetical protein
MGIAELFSRRLQTAACIFCRPIKFIRAADREAI